jgi:hypothetical protein
MLIITLLLLCQLLALQADVVAPGHAGFWFPHHEFDTEGGGVDGAGTQSTKTMHAGDVVSRVDTLAQDADVVVFLHSDSVNAALASDTVKRSVKASSHYEVMSNVYASSSSSVAKEVAATSTTMQMAQAVTAEQLCVAVDDPGAFASKKGTYRVTDAALGVPCTRKLHAAASSSKVLMVAVGDSVAMAPPAAAAAAAVAGRRLEDAETEVNNGYVIYYDSTYLLITPDIFTGIMTMLFLFVVGLIGFTCLGSIQGPYSFVDRNPTVGKEC